MTPADVHTLVGAYVLDALDSDERSAVEDHLEACTACADEVAELRAVAAELAADAAEAVPAALRSAVMAQVAVTRQLPPALRRLEPAAVAPTAVAPTAVAPTAVAPTAVPPVEAARRPRRWPRPLTAVAAGLVAVSAGLGAVVVDQQTRLDTARQQSEVLDALAATTLDSPASSPVAGGGRLAVIGARDAAAGVALVVARDLPDLPEGMVYQLWLVGAQAPRPAGTLVGGTGSTDHLVPTSATDTDIALTVEPAGKALQPTLPLLVSVPLRV